MKEIRLNSVLYAQLFNEGGDKLISLYVQLKACKNSRIKIKAHKSTKGHKLQRYGLLRKESHLSLSVLKTYLPQLMRLGLCWFDNNGDFVMLGNRKINELYKTKKRLKIVRVRVGNSFKETQMYSYLVRIKSSQLQQEKHAAVKAHRENLVAKHTKGYFLKPNERQQLNRILEKNLSYINITDKSVLSHAGFAKLKTQELNYPSKGEYWRNKMVKAGLIKVKLRREFIGEYTYKQFLQLKYVKKNLIFDSGKVYEQLPSEFKVVSDIIKPVKPAPPKESPKKKEAVTRSFDFIDWCKRN